MRASWLYTHYLLLVLVHGYPKRIPVGALFDEEAQHAHTAFRYKIDKHNNSSANNDFKLDKYEKIIVASDSYEIIKAMCSIMLKGSFAFFGVTNENTLSVLESYGRTFNMPYVTHSAPTNRSREIANYGYVLHVRPTYDEAMVEIIKFYKWGQVFYIYDNDEGLARLQWLHTRVADRGPKVYIDSMRLIDINNCYSLLRHLDSRIKSSEKYIILDLSSEKALEVVLRQIQNVGMNRADYHYLLGSLVMDELNLDDFKHGGVNITGFRLVNPNFTEVKEIQKDWSRLNANSWVGAGDGKKIRLNAALTMDAVTVIIHGINSMLKYDPDVFKTTFRRGQVFNNGSRGSANCRPEPPMPWQHGQALIRAFKKVDFDGVTGKVAFDEAGFRTNFRLDILELGLNSEPKQIGSWDAKTGLRIKRERRINPTPATEKNANKTITTILSSPYLMKRKQPEEGKPLTGNDIFEGYCHELAAELAKKVGFDYVLKEVADNKYGEKMEDGRWNGMVGELTDKKADLAVAPLTISSMRERVIDFSKPFMSLGISIMIKKPEKQKPGVFSFMDPLSYEIWLCIVFAYLGVSVVLFLVSRFSPYEWQIEDSVNGPTFTNDFTLLNSLWFSLGAFMQQGCDISPRSLSGRIVGSVWWFFTLILISSYTANLAAFLTVERMLTPIESADDLAKQTTIQYGTLDSGSTKNFFATSRIAVYETMWTFMSTADPSVFVSTTDEGVARVRNSKGKYAFLLESTMNDFHNQRKPCNTMKVGGNLDSKGYGIATPLGSELREAISLAVLGLREVGFLQKLHKKWWYDKGECAVESEGKGSSQSALTLSNVAGIFYILIGGLGLSMIVSLLEFLYKSKIESRRRNNNEIEDHEETSRASIVF